MSKNIRTPSAVDQVRIGFITVSKRQIKTVLIIFGLSIMATVLFYTKTIVDELVLNEQRTVDLYAKLLGRSAQESNDQDLLFYLENAYSSIHFPVIITGRDEQPIYPFQQFMLNVDLDSTKSVEDQRVYLQGLIAEMKAEHPPFVITMPDGKVIQKIFFANSAVIRRLRYMPVVEILMVSAFILVGYVAFSTIRRNEESNIWVGMAKEAAHQLGTPLSSLLAWLEILRSSSTDKQLAERTIGEMEQDVERLKVIANRFSKIGSLPKLETVNLGDVVEKTCRYFDTRLPALGRRVTITREVDSDIQCSISVELFAWVIENLIKNAVESIERQDGRIDIGVQQTKAGIRILVTDNGKGMSAALKKRVFQPGYTTKRRGWGLGLSLSKRIVEEYHHGKLYVKESQPGVGTTFAIELPNLQ
ncbi:MAG: HAMP domain-containing histidine kinase [Bradyrhizobiaceae bacterium]|nr:HAMP domain-containing histidine kinase [Bradyrhizobiaceae bacterium]